MRISTRATKKTSVRRAAREDGDATKARIIEAAGRLFAERGYAETTSKDICERVEINLAAVNYHFGSREGLYLAVLESVKKYMFDAEELGQLSRSQLCPRDKICNFIDRVVETVFARDSWQVRIWAREMVSPSGLFFRDDLEHALIKFGMVASMFSEYTGIPVDSPMLHHVIHTIMSQFMVMLIVGQHNSGPHQIVFQAGPERFAATSKEVTLIVLDAFREKHAQGLLTGTQAPDICHAAIQPTPQGRADMFKLMPS